MSSWKPYHQALTVIAQKELPNCTSWYQWSTDDRNYYCCLICGDLIMVDFSDNGPFNSHLRAHGVQHLKDKNLLSFI